VVEVVLDSVFAGADVVVAEVEAVLEELESMLLLEALRESVR
jgi:hypothetical protein